MLTKFVWIAGLLLELTILARAIPTGLYRRLPIFYVYLAVVFASSASEMALFNYPHMYALVFWTWEVITIVFGYGVVLEIMHLAFEDYPGAERMARYLGFIAFAVLFAGVAITGWAHKLPVIVSDAGTQFDVFERDLRIVQAIFLFIVAVIVLHYGIELGKNVSGVAIGFGIYIAAALLNQALSVQFSAKYLPIFQHAQSDAYLLTLGVWAVALWSPATAKSTPPSAQLEADYEAVAAKTKERLKALRSNFTPTSLW
jgi:hypothetical protein